MPLFGGWLDEGLAGRKSRHAQHSPHPVESAAKATDEVHVTRAAADAFAAAMHLFNKGSYRQAVALYNKAVQLVGLSSRTGGQYQLWHAQALDAAGDRKVATETLQQLASHPDADVRKVSQELLFIITAPALELDASMFMHVPSLDDAPTPSGALLTSNYGPLRTALVNKSPEPYTLQWYIKKERPPKVTKDNSAIQALALMAAVFSTFTFMLVSPH